MKRSSSDQATLAVTAPDQATEIFVVDSALRRLASGVGELRMSVEPGIYKIRFRAGSTQHDELVSVTPTDTYVTVSPPPVRFHSAAPLAETQTTHEYHVAPAHSTSRALHGKVGHGSQLFVFVREEDAAEPEFDVSHVTLHDLHGSPIASMTDGEVGPIDKYAGLNVEVDPGTYSVRIDTGPVGNYEMFVTTTPGWQTQLFLVTETFAERDLQVRRPSLRLASMLMARAGAGFDFARPDARLAELARLGLSSNRMVMSESDLESMLHGKFEDPLLGVYGAYLLAMRHHPDWRLFSVVVGRVLELLGDHPDAQALALLREHQDGRRVVAITAPPSLSRSWQAIVRASRDRPSLLPPDGPVSEVASNLMHTGTWLVHRVEAGRDAPAVADPSAETASAVLHRLLAHDRRRLPEMVAGARERGTRFTELEGNIISAVASEQMWHDVPSTMGPENADLQARRLIRRIAAPPAAVKKSLGSLQTKLEM